jgi:Tol biopolymer transport system component
MLYGRSDVFTVGTDGAIKVLTKSDEYSYGGAQFSPDGLWILSTRSTSTDAVIRNKMNNGGAVDLVVIPAAGGKEINLTANWDYLPQGAFWDDAGKYIYFTGGIGGTTRLGAGRNRRADHDRPASAERIQLRPRSHEDGVSGRYVRGAL